jgi:hypothetical protein
MSTVAMARKHLAASELTSFRQALGFFEAIDSKVNLPSALAPKTPRRGEVT